MLTVDGTLVLEESCYKKSCYKSQETAEQIVTAL